MSDIGTLFGGLVGKSKGDFADGNARFVTYKNVYANPETDLLADDFVRIGPSERQRQLRRGDVLLTGSSENREECGFSSVIAKEPTGPLYLNSFCICFRPFDADLMDAQYTKHLFRSDTMREQIKRTASGVTRFNVSKAHLAKVRIPIPPREEQEGIAGTLNALEALVNDLNIGLPAELAARRKQYEYYRDKLLTFTEAV